MHVFRVALSGSAFGLVGRRLRDISNAPAQPTGSATAIIVLAIRHDVFSASTWARSEAARAA
jgi:hypothetical protein